MFRITEDPSGSLVQCLAKHCTRLPDDGSSVIRKCWSTFKYFVILILSTYYTLCISWIIKCLITIDARCEHEDSTLVVLPCQMLLWRAPSVDSNLA